MDFNKFAKQCASEHKMEIAREKYMKYFRRKMLIDKTGRFITKEQLSFFLNSINKKDLT